MSDQAHTTIFGPITSRRFGRSLGVDIIPRKLCTLDCVYCEVGRTDKRGFARKEYSAVGTILDELAQAIPLHPSLDCITFSGSGEPTLHSRLGEVLLGTRNLTDLSLNVLTNGSLLWREDVRLELLAADIVSPSYNAVSEDIFRRINRPHPRLSAALVLEGLLAFREVYRGKFYLEILFVHGLNDTDEEVARLKSACDRIEPDRIHLNTVTRPPAEPWAKAVPFGRLMTIASVLGPKAEVLVPRTPPATVTNRSVDPADVMSLVERRAMSVREIMSSLSADENAVTDCLQDLVRSGKIHAVFFDGEDYFAPSHLADPS